MTLVKKRKLRWFGYIPRSSGYANMILEGTVIGQKKRWEDNIKQWTQLEFASSTRTDKNKEKVIVAKSSMEAQRSCKVNG